MLGERVNIYPLKVCSIAVFLDDAASQAGAPTVSLLDDATKLVTSRLGADRIRPLTDWVAQCSPDVKTNRVVPWAGLRPMLPDMLPRVGPGRSPGVYYNTGHGHPGWTLCAVTADMVAAMVATTRELQRPACLFVPHRA